MQKKEYGEALYHEWVPGVTLREWATNTQQCLESVPHQTGDVQVSHSATTSFQLAWDIAMALADMHNLGVIHGNFNARHIIVDDSNYTR
eukprot:11865242-Ditylum_brightwellii.AAC.1